MAEQRHKINIQDNQYHGYRIFGEKVFTVYDYQTSRDIVQIDGFGSVLLSYLYPNRAEASRALKSWDGIGHPPGQWVTMSGTFEDVPVDNSPNPNFPEEPV